MTGLTVIVLAAGEGTRMRSKTPKLLHLVAGLPIIGHVVKAARSGGAAQIGLVTSPSADALRQTISEIDGDVEHFTQAVPQGTADAAKAARDLFAQAEGYVAVVYGDHPLLTGEIFRLVTERLDAGWDSAILGFEPVDATGYGRLVTDGERLTDIVEHKDTSEEQRRIGLCNACILGFRAETFRAVIDKVGNDNAQNEYYLGDLVPLANEAGYRVTYAVAPEADVMGVNSREQLAVAEILMQQRLRARALAGGATLLDPATTYFSHDTQIGQDVLIEPGVIFGPAVSIADNVTIKAYSHLEGATVASGAVIGPFARLRPGTVLDADTKVGNFVETKKARVEAGAKINHLSYVGDARVGARANVGAGTITCNYDGLNKHHTDIGEDTFIGSNSALVAPVSIGNGAMIAAGSTITRDVGPDELGVARGRQDNKVGYAAKIRARNAALKKAKGK